MVLAPIPTYKEIFSEEQPEISELIYDIPSKSLIGVLASINAQIFLGDDSFESQLKILNWLTRRFKPDQKRKISTIIKKLFENKDRYRIFSVWVSLEFIQYELLNYRDFEIIDTTPEQEFRLFKAYTIFSGKTIQLADENFTKDNPFQSKTNDEYLFQRANWPFITKQLEFNLRHDPLYKTIINYVFLNELSKDEKGRIAVNQLLNIFGKETIWQLLFHLVQLSKLSYEKYQTSEFEIFSISAGQESEILFNALSIDLSNYQADPKNLINFTGIRSKPFFKYAEGQYLVLNWNFLYSKDILFDLFFNTDLKNHFQNFPEFKSKEIGHLAEKSIFKKLLNGAYNEMAQSILFDDDNLGVPDCYLRIGKTVFLFEFKDNLMPATCVDSQNYITIKQEIDNKFIKSNKNKSKGISQLVNHINNLTENPFERDQFNSKGIKISSLVVYPILVYTQSSYYIPGINNYLNSEFRKILNKPSNEIKPSFTIKDLTFINLNFFYTHFYKIKTKKVNLKQLLDDYHRICKNRIIRHEKAKSMNNFLRMMPNFEDTLRHSIPERFQRKDEKFIETVLEALDIKFD